MSEEMRKEFEDLVVSGDLIPDLFTGCVMYANRVKMVSDCFDGKEYKNGAVQSCFDAFKSGWKASRESMKPIKLPDTSKYRVGVEYGDGLSNGRNNAILQCSEILQQAGYKVEE